MGYMVWDFTRWPIYGTHMGNLGISQLTHVGPGRFPRCNVYMGPTWVVWFSHGPHFSQMGPMWDSKMVPIWLSHISLMEPTWVPCILLAGKFCDLADEHGKVGKKIKNKNKNLPPYPTFLEKGTLTNFFIWRYHSQKYIFPQCVANSLLVCIKISVFSDKMRLILPS